LNSDAQLIQMHCFLSIAYGPLTTRVVFKTYSNRDVVGVTWFLNNAVMVHW